MPAMQAQAKSSPQGKNVLSSDVQITGNLKFTSDLLVDGAIDGEVNSEGNLTLGENGRIKGDVRAKSITIYGKISGNVNVTGRCVLMSTAELIGDIRASMLSIEEGAVFMGASTVGRALGAKA